MKPAITIVVLSFLLLVAVPAVPAAAQTAAPSSQIPSLQQEQQRLQEMLRDLSQRIDQLQRNGLPACRRRPPGQDPGPWRHPQSHAGGRRLVDQHGSGHTTRIERRSESEDRTHVRGPSPEHRLSQRTDREGRIAAGSAA